jgi:predicted membrane chloride channel (bestrophin family)
MYQICRLVFLILFIQSSHSFINQIKTINKYEKNIFRRAGPAFIFPSTAFTDEDLKNRRYASRDWFYCLKGWPSSRILRRLQSNLLAIGIWTFLLNGFLEITKTKIVFPFFLHGIVGSALGLLLVFKTNTSYDRFWEGRKLWGAVIGACRNLTRLAYIHIDKSFHIDIIRLLMCFCISMKQHLKNEINIIEYNSYLHENDINHIIKCKNTPLIILRKLDSNINAYLENNQYLKYKNQRLADTLAAEFRQFINILSNSLGYIHII